MSRHFLVSDVSQSVVYIIDDDEAVRDSIMELLESVNLNAKAYANALDFLTDIQVTCRGCIVLDVRMSGMGGLALQQRLSELKISLPIIFITGHGDVDMAVQALKAGAIDFIQKPYHEQNLLDSINLALEQDAVEHDKNRLFAHLADKIKELTSREDQVLRLLLKGMTNKSIGAQLNISSRTAEVHRQHIFEKFDVHSASQLISLLNQFQMPCE